MKNLKLIVLSVLAFVTIVSMVFVSCQKPVEVIPQKNTEVKTNSITLSKEIFDLDKKVSTNKPTRVNWRKVAGYAEADGGAAYGTFKVTVGFAGPGYAAAFGFLGGICGSVYYGWKEKDFLVTNQPFTPGNGSVLQIEDIDMSSPTKEGDIHNLLLNEINNQPNLINTNTEDDFMSTSYLYLTKRACEIYQLDINIFRNGFPLEKYIQIAKADYLNLNFVSTLNLKNPAMNSFMNEYFTRIYNNDNLGLNDFILYTDLFIKNCNNQSSLSNEEKTYLVSVLSIYKSSAKFWINV
jgi:hypothetical protein